MIDKKLVGPPFEDIIIKETKKWFVDFTLNSKKMIENKNPKAIKVFEENAKIDHPEFEQLNKKDVKKIFTYLKSQINQKPGKH